MADTQLQLPPGYEDAKPVQAQASGLQLPAGYEDAKPVSASSPEREALIHPTTGQVPKLPGSSYEMRPVLPSGERVGSMQAAPGKNKMSAGDVASGLWESANTPLVPEGEMEKNAHELAQEQERMGHPYRSAAYQSAADAGKTARQFLTSPLAIGTLGVGPLLEEAGGAVKAGAKLLPLAFGAGGAQEAYKGAKDITKEGVTPENLQQTLSGAGQLALGGAGTAEGTEFGNKPASEVATAPIRAAGKMYNFATQDVPGAIGYVAGGRPGYYAAKGLAHVLPEAGENVTEFGKPEKAVNFEKLDKKAVEVEKKAKEAEADVNSYAASEAQVPGSTPEEVVKKAERLRQAADTARFHADAAKEALEASRAPKEKSTPDKPITTDRMAGLQNDIDRMAPRPGMPMQGPEPGPAPKPQNVKGPGEVQPETIAQPTEELPRVPRAGQETLANNQGRMGRTYALPEAPLNLPQEVLPPEREAPAPKAEKQPVTIEGGFAPVPPDETVKAPANATKKSVDKVGELVNEGLGNERLKPNVPLKEQGPKIRSEVEPEVPKAEAPKEPEKLSSDPRKATLQKAGATPEEMDKILSRGTKTDPTSKVGLSKLAEHFGVDLGDKAIGRGKGDVAAGTHLSPDQVLQQIIDAGHTPKDIAQAISEGKHLPTVAGGAPDESTKVGSDEEARKDTEHFLNARKELGNKASFSDVAKRAQEMKDAANKPVDVAKSADDYNKEAGLPKIKPEKVAKDPKAAQIADEFEAMKHDPNNAAVKKSYNALVDDVKKQWDYATKKMGLKIEPTDTDPYKSYEEMKDDVDKNKTMKVWRGGNELQEGHPLAKTDPDTGESYNTMFRAVHDIFGHVAQDHDFGEPGEESAWNVHRQMMSPEAVPAMTTETKGQTSWFFNNKGVREGEPLGKFADQKAGLLPSYSNSNPRLAADIGEWKAPPELGVSSAEDLGVKVRAANPEPTGRGSNKALEQAEALGGERRTGEGLQEGQTEQRSGKDRRAAERKAQSAEDDLFRRARQELGDDASTEDVEKRMEQLRNVPKATMETARMSEDDLLKNGFSRDDIENGRHLPSVSGAASKGKMPTGDQLIKKYGEADDPSHIAFLLDDGRGVAQTGTLHDVMLGGKPTDNLREKFVNDAGAIRMRVSGAYGDRRFALSLPEKGITEAQLDKLNKYAPQLSTGAVHLEVARPDGKFKIMDMPHKEFQENFEKNIRELVPVLNDKGAPVDEFRNPTVSGGSQAASGKAKVGALPKLAEEHLTPEEKAGVTKSEAGRKSFVDNLKKLPSVQEFTDIAKAGEGGKDWYSRSVKAFDALHEEAPKYFQDGDRAKFTDFVASLSPQQTVKMNLGEALNAWTRYVDEGRPTGKPLEKLLKDELTLPGAKIPNAMKALAGEPLWPDLSKNSNFKVPSFAKNLQGYLNHVTNDGWQGLFAGIDAKALSKPTSYHPLAVVTRAAADALGWDPAEAQAAIWAFTKTFTEKGETDPKIIRRYSEDFADIMAHDPEIRQQLAQLGVDHDKLDAKLRAIGKKPAITPGASPTVENSIRKLASRIETARGKGTIPPPKTGYLDYGEPGEDEEDTSFDPDQFRTQTSERMKKKK